MSTIGKNTLSIVSILIVTLSLTCKKDLKSSDKEILKFTVPGQVDSTLIDSKTATITLTLGANADLTKIIPSIIISKNAKISPLSGTLEDFSKGPIKYIVTADDNSTKSWTITIKRQQYASANIVSFTFPEIAANAIVDTLKDSVWLQVDYGTSIKAITPSITVSSGASISPASGSVVDFSAGFVVFTVTAENGVQKKWTVIIQTNTDILSIKIPSQVGKAVISGQNITMQTNYGTDLSSVSPTIIIPAGSTISPASGTPVDFSKGRVVYTVTASDGKSFYYNVRANWFVYTADNAYYQYVGRISFANPKLPRLWASGSYVIAQFRGTSCQIVLNDENRYTTYNNFLEIVVDGTKFYRLQTTGGSNFRTNIVSGLTDGIHSLVICKNTEASIGYIEFVGLSCQELLAAPFLPTRKIECYGNSITCGANSDTSQNPCSFENTVWYGNHNAYLAYGPVMARNMNAQYHLTSYSGIGLLHSCCSMTFTMPDIYNTTDLSKGGIAWDFSQYVPDVVTICLGQNDGTQSDSATFVSAYVNFVQNIRSNYPNAHIFCITSPMEDATLKAYLVKCVTGVANYCNNNGDAKVHKFVFANSYNSGCGSHPSIAQHQLIASELQTYIQSVMGW